MATGPLPHSEDIPLPVYQPEPRRLLVVRLSAIGDLVMALPLLPMLRRTWPRAHLAWLVQPEGAELLAGHPDLDQVLVWPRERWRDLRARRRWRDLWREFGALRESLRGFDTVLDLQGLLKSALWTRLTGAPRRIGLRPREGSRVFFTERVEAPGDDPYMGSEYRRLAEVLNLAGEFRPHLPLTAADREQARALVGARGGYVALCPFTTRPQKHWFADRWVELAGQIQKRLGLAAVLLGGPGDRPAAAALAARAGDGLVDLTGRTGLRQAAAVIAGARALVGVDTGLTHMAAAVGTPSVALFGATRPYLATGTPRARVLYQDLPCAPCRRRPTCGGRYDCMGALDVAQVRRALAAVLETP